MGKSINFEEELKWGSQCSSVIPVDDFRVQLEVFQVEDERVSALSANVEVATVLGKAAPGNLLATVVCMCGSVCVCVCVSVCVCVYVCVCVCVYV